MVDQVTEIKPESLVTIAAAERCLSLTYSTMPIKQNDQAITPDCQDPLNYPVEREIV